MNKKGFTLVEVISVIALLGLIIGLAVPNVMRSTKKAKERTLNTKIKNIEKAAVLYGQDNRGKFTKDMTEPGISECLKKYCPKDDENNPISNCYCFETTITVNALAEGPDGDEDTDDAYIEYDDKENKKILNSTDESKYLNDCEIQIYQKYGKIYAVYTKSVNDEYNRNCWINLEE